MKQKIATILNKKYAVVCTLLLTPILGLIDRNMVFFAALGVAFATLWSNHYHSKDFGLAKKLTKKTVISSSMISVLLLLVFYTLEAFLEIYFGKIDISSLEDVRGDFVSYIITLLIVWIFAAFGEEFLFRGYYMKRLSILFGGTKKAWLLSAILISIYFGISHSYQGIAGVIGVVLWHFCISLLFYKNKENLWAPILIHGIYDTIGLTLLFFSKERFIYDWVTQ